MNEKRFEIIVENQPEDIDFFKFAQMKNFIEIYADISFSILPTDDNYKKSSMVLSNMIDKMRKEIFINHSNSEIYLFDKFSKSILK
jgi:hypothetical protein